MLSLRSAPAGRILACATAVVACIAGLACDSGSSSGAGGGSSPAGGRGGAPLVVDTSFVVQGLDPNRYHTPTQLIMAKAVYDTLLTSDPDGTEPKPSVAESYSESDGHRTYTFKLRDDVRFSDGTPLTSADVVFSFRRVINLKTGSSAFLEGVTVTAPDRRTVVLKSEQPNPALPKIVMTPTLAIVNAKVAKAEGATDGPNAATADRSEPFFNSESAGSGPYVLDSYRANEEIRLTANPKYWGAEPEFQVVVIRNMQAPTQRLRVQRGTNEVAIDLSSRQAEELEGNDDLRVSVSPSPIVFNVGMNTDPSVSEVAANEHIQRAVRYGIDYAGLLDVVGPGAVRAAGVIPSQLPGALPESDEVPYDPDKARDEVAASGLSDPSLTLAYPSDLSVNGIEFATPAQRVKADLEKIGISADLRAIPTTTFLEQYNAGELDMVQVYWVVNYPDPSDALKFVPGGTYAVRLKWDAGDDPGIERLADRAAVTADEARRTELFQQLQARLNEDSPWVAQFQPAQAIVGSANLTNLVLNPTWILDVAAIGSK